MTAESIASYDVVLLATHHRAFDHGAIARSAKLIVDTRNAFAGHPVEASRYFKA